ncbi:MAG: sulfotransferase domain-containing protein [Parvibaculum sp.]
MGKLLWIASYPKSGNTWVRSFLYNLLHRTSAPADINQLNTMALNTSSRRWFEEVASEPLEELAPEELARLRPLAQQRMAASRPNAIPVKTHNYLGDWFNVPLHEMALTAGAIYIIRNPLDLVLSLAPHRSISVDQAIDFISTRGVGTKLASSHMPEVYDTWSNHVASWTAKKSAALLVVRYEDLLSQPLNAFGAIARLVGAGGDSENLDRAIRHSSFSVLSEQEEKQGFREKPSNAEAFFRVGKAEQWRTELTPDQVRRVISDHREQMTRFGYVPAEYV